MNWLGQEIEVGDHVYKGARAGNSSDFRVGEVLELRQKDYDIETVDPDGHSIDLIEAKVRWEWTFGWYWRKRLWEDKMSHRQMGAMKSYQSRPGWNDINTLVKVDVSNIQIVRPEDEPGIL